MSVLIKLWSCAAATGRPISLRWSRCSPALFPARRKTVTILAGLNQMKIPHFSLQMSYAARDAQASIALFLSLLGLLSEAGPASSSGSSYPELSARCQGLVDVPFRGRGDGDGEGKRRPWRSPAPDSPESGDQQVPDPRRNSKRKALGVGYSAR